MAAAAEITQFYYTVVTERKRGLPRRLVGINTEEDTAQIIHKSIEEKAVSILVSTAANTMSVPCAAMSSMDRRVRILDYVKCHFYYSIKSVCVLSVEYRAFALRH